MKKFFKGHEKESVQSTASGEQAVQHIDDSLLHAAQGGSRFRKVVLASIGTPPPPPPPPEWKEWESSWDVSGMRS